MSWLSLMCLCVRCCFLQQCCLEQLSVLGCRKNRKLNAHISCLKGNPRCMALHTHTHNACKTKYLKIQKWWTFSLEVSFVLMIVSCICCRFRSECLWSTAVRLRSFDCRVHGSSTLQPFSHLLMFWAAATVPLCISFFSTINQSGLQWGEQWNDPSPASNKHTKPIKHTFSHTHLHLTKTPHTANQSRTSKRRRKKKKRRRSQERKKEEEEEEK